MNKKQHENLKESLYKGKRINHRLVKFIIVNLQV